MDVRAAVLRKIGAPLVIEHLTLDEPRPDEVLVRLVATGVCHSDISILKGLFPPPPPLVAGHEGAGVVEAVGSAVTHVAPGDHVVLSFGSCGRCDSCAGGHAARCANFYAHNQLGTRPDRSATLMSPSGPVGGSFFSQSSFATHALATARNTVKVSKAAPLELLGPLGCGFQTGAGTVINVIKPKPGSSIAVFGCGAVGLAAIMAAKIAACDPVVAVDVHASRLDIARGLGASITVDASTADVTPSLGEMGGFDATIEASGAPGVLESALAALKAGGVCCMLGVGRMEATATFPLLSLMGRTLRGVVEGDSDPHQFIPWMIDRYLAGSFPIDRLVRFYALEQVNQAIADSIGGATIKPVLRMSAS